ncbi:hypothetical protein XANCAGTX0491_008812 [Xanthoria calcicola]
MQPQGRRKPLDTEVFIIGTDGVPAFRKFASFVGARDRAEKSSRTVVFNGKKGNFHKKKNVEAYSNRR